MNQIRKYKIDLDDENNWSEGEGREVVVPAVDVKKLLEGVFEILLKFHRDYETSSEYINCCEAVELAINSLKGN